METTVNISSTKRLERPVSGRRVAGVCAGLGQYFDVSPAFYRLGFVVLTLLGGAGILVYLAAVLIIPEEGKTESIAGEALAERREKPWSLIGIGLVGAAITVLLARATLWPVAGSGWLLILIFGLLVLWASRGSSRGRVLMRALIGTTAMLVLAVVVAIAIAISWFDVSLSDGAGNKSYEPTAASALHSNYNLGVGELHLDLTNVGPITKDTVVHAKVGIGEVLVTVPPGVKVAVNSHAKVGSLDILNQHHDGRNARFASGQGAKLTIDASVGAGEVRVERAAR
jgi:phage shock protein PspC (stress-responsive transcriptional regulator)